MIKLKDILNEFVDTSIMKLVDYIASPIQDRVEEVIQHIGEKNIIKWFIENDGASTYFTNSYNIDYDYKPHRDEILKYDDLKTLKKNHPKLYDELISLLKEMIEGKNLMGMQLSDLYREFSDNPSISNATLPTWRYLTEPSLVKNQWLIHVTTEERVESIFKSGFIRGINDLTKLGLTTWFDGKSAEKKGGGYNFAYTPEDFETYGIPYGETKYGDGRSFVVFRASGIRCWHKTDLEHQVIFNGKTAQDIVPVFLHPNTGWTVYSKNKKPIFKTSASKTGALKLVTWIEENYNQYRKSIGWKKND